MAALNLEHKKSFIATEFLNLDSNKKYKQVIVTDPDLVLAIRKGDEGAFESVFKCYYERLCVYASSLLRDDEEAEEVVQVVFLTIWEKRQELEITLSLKSYLYRAVHNHCLNRFKHEAIKRKHQEYSKHFLTPYQESVTEAILADELSEKIERAVMGLPEQCQRAFRMSRFEDMKYQQIADELGISIKTVENQIGKALRILRQALSEYLPVIVSFVFGLLEIFRSGKI